MLSGNARFLFNYKSKKSQSYEEAIILLKTWFNSRENQTRLLREWKGMRLTLSMESKPETLEMKVYKSFVGKVMSIQKQLDSSYHGYRYLRDQLMTAIDIPVVQYPLKDRVPRSS